MFKPLSIASGIAFLLLQGCAPEQQSGKGVFELVGSDAPKKSTLPPSYVECNGTFSWSTQRFEKNAALFSSNDPKHLGQTNVAAQNVTVGVRSNTFSSRNQVNLSAEENRICDQIYQKVATGFGDMAMEYRFVQYFDYKDVKRLTSAKKDYQEVKHQTAMIENSAYAYDEILKVKNNMYNLQIPVMVECENKWTVKPSTDYPTWATFKKPDGKCNFSTEGFDLDLPSGDKKRIILKGNYQSDPQNPRANLKISIEKFGFERSPR